jgi:hypothetical protein
MTLTPQEITVDMKWATIGIAASGLASEIEPRALNRPRAFPNIADYEFQMLSEQR